jgi:hypothetical protein
MRRDGGRSGAAQLCGLALRMRRRVCTGTPWVALPRFVCDTASLAHRLGPSRRPDLILLRSHQTGSGLLDSEHPRMRRPQTGPYCGWFVRPSATHDELPPEPLNGRWSGWVLTVLRGRHLLELSWDAGRLTWALQLPRRWVHAETETSPTSNAS